jgi:hypothetical protein
MKQLFNKILLLSVVIFGISNQPMITGEPEFRIDTSVQPIHTDDDETWEEIHPIKERVWGKETRAEQQTKNEDQPWHKRLGKSLSERWNKLWSKPESKNPERTAQPDSEMQRLDKPTNHVTFHFEPEHSQSIGHIETSAGISAEDEPGINDQKSTINDQKSNMYDTKFNSILADPDTDTQYLIKQLKETPIENLSLNDLSATTSAEILKRLFQDPASLKNLDPKKYNQLVRNLGSYSARYSDIIQSLKPNFDLQKLPDYVLNSIANKMSPDQLFVLTREQLSDVLNHEKEHQGTNKYTEIETLLKIKKSWNWGILKKLGLKDGSDVMFEYLTSPEISPDTTLDQKLQSLKPALVNLQPTQLAELFNKITAHEIAKQTQAGAQQDVLAADLYKDKFDELQTTFKKFMPKGQVLLLDHDDIDSPESFAFKILAIPPAPDMTIQQQVESVYKNQHLGLSKEQIQKEIRDYYKNLPDGELRLQKIDSELAREHREKTEEATKQAQKDAHSRNETTRKQIEKDPKTYVKLYLQAEMMGKEPFSAERTNLLKQVLEQMPAPQRAAYLTNAVRSIVEETGANAEETFEKITEMLSNIKLLPDTDMLMLGHKDDKGISESFHFKIADMTDFTYNPTETMLENAARLNKKQGLRMLDLTKLENSMQHYFVNHPSVENLKATVSNILLSGSFKELSLTQGEDIQAAGFSKKELETILTKSLLRRENINDNQKESIQEFLDQYQKIMPENLQLAVHGNSTVTVYDLKEWADKSPQDVIKSLRQMSAGSIEQLPPAIINAPNVLDALFDSGTFEIMRDNFTARQRIELIKKIDPEKNLRTLKTVVNSIYLQAIEEYSGILKGQTKNMDAFVDLVNSDVVDKNQELAQDYDIKLAQTKYLQAKNKFVQKEEDEDYEVIDDPNEKLYLNKLITEGYTLEQAEAAWQANKSPLNSHDHESGSTARAESTAPTDLHTLLNMDTTELAEKIPNISDVKTLGDLLNAANNKARLDNKFDLLKNILDNITDQQIKDLQLNYPDAIKLAQEAATQAKLSLKDSAFTKLIPANISDVPWYDRFGAPHKYEEFATWLQARPKDQREQVIKDILTNPKATNFAQPEYLKTLIPEIKDTKILAEILNVTRANTITHPKHGVTLTTILNSLSDTQIQNLQKNPETRQALTTSLSAIRGKAFLPGSAFKLDEKLKAIF